MLAGATMLTAAGFMMLAERSPRLNPVRWLRSVETPLRLEVLTVYCFAFWHKLNSDYLDPERSCAVALVRQLVDAVPFLDHGNWAPELPIYGSLLIEGAIPCLLALPRTRNVGLVLGGLFHIALGIGYFYGFSATMISLLFLFAPRDFGLSLSAWCKKGPLTRLASVLDPRLLRALLALVLIVLSVLISVSVYMLFWSVWWFYSCLMIICLFVYFFNRRFSPSPAPFPRTSLALMAFPALAFLNGASPYLGLKTETSFAMYSNLRTEKGQSNHLLIRQPLALADYQTDLVVIENSSDERLQLRSDEGNPIPYISLRRRVWQQSLKGTRNLSVTYRRGPVRRVVQAAEKDPELSSPPSYLERKFLRFRQILPRDRNVCAH